MGQQVHAVVLDFRKAFDTVLHSLLVKKLITNNFDPFLVRWIYDFLNNRKQRVVIGGCSSNEIPVTSGVPQGSVLGPKLFLLYINDLPLTVKCKVSLFADDTLLFTPIESDEDQTRFQQDIDAAVQRANKWGMQFNTSKTKLMVFGKQRSGSQNTKYTINQATIDQASSVRYLGITLQDDLKFTKHMENIIAKACRVLGMIKRTLPTAPEKAKAIAYKTLCRPVLEYSSQVWDPHSRGKCYKLEMVQNRAIRFICKAKGRDFSISKAREKLKIKTLEERRSNSRKTLLLKMIGETHNVLGDFLENETITTNPHNTRAKSHNLLPSITTNSTIYFNSFLPRTTRDLRNLSDDDLNVEYPNPL